MPHSEVEVCTEVKEPIVEEYQIQEEILKISQGKKEVIKQHGSFYTMST